MRGEHHERIASAGTKAADSRQVRAILDGLERKRAARASPGKRLTKKFSRATEQGGLEAVSGFHGSLFASTSLRNDTMSRSKAATSSAIRAARPSSSSIEHAGASAAVAMASTPTAGSTSRCFL